MTRPISDSVLTHYGVLGMKWGVRKDNQPQGTLGSGPEYDAKPKGPSRREAKQQKKEAKRASKEVRKEERRKQQAERKKFKTMSLDEKNEYVSKKVTDIVKEINENPKGMTSIMVSTQQGRILATGEDFMRFLEEGGAFDPLATGVVGVWTKNDKKD